MASVTAMEVVGKMVGYSIFYNIYAQTQNVMRGLVFLVMAGFYLAGMLMLM
jgi:hypothetical protein